MSPWMRNGNIRDYAIRNPEVDRFKLVGFSLSAIGTLANSTQLVDVCRGLQYMHAQDIVHGDLKGVCHCPVLLSITC